MMIRRRRNGPTVVLQHGFLGSAGYWRPLIERLPDEFGIIAPSLPGFSRAHPLEHSFDGFARTLMGVLDEHSIGEFHLVGHSMGGMIAQQVAVRWPTRVRRLVLYGTAATGVLPERFESPTESISRLAAEGVRATAERIIASWLTKGPANQYYKDGVEAAGAWSAEAAGNALAVLPSWDGRTDLSNVAHPALVICGDRDRSTAPQESLRLWKLLRNAQLCVLPGCAHAAHLDKPDLFAALVTDFLLEEST